IFVLANQWRNKGLENMFEHEELFGGSWIGAYSALCFSCGYFAYDQLDMLRYRLYSGWLPGILMHHLILLICFTLALYRNVTINYLNLSLVCELHSIFLHLPLALLGMAGMNLLNIFLGLDLLKAFTRERNKYNIISAGGNRKEEKRTMYQTPCNLLGGLAFYLTSFVLNIILQIKNGDSFERPTLQLSKHTDR
ncbi:hypothetical protein ACJX0J_017548, partial [Zea mays]